MSSRFPSLFALVSLFLLPACESEVISPLLLVNGEASLYDEWGAPLPSPGNVTVSLLDPGLTTVAETETDSEGRFSLELPDEGVYSLAFRKEGFGTMYRFDIDEDTGDIDVDLFARSSVQVASVAASGGSETQCGTVPCLFLTLNVQGFFGPSPGRRIFRVFLSTETGVGPQSYQASQFLIASSEDPGLARDGPDATVEVGPLHGFLGNFPVGVRVYVAVYGATENLSNSYIDPVTGLEIFTDLSESSATGSFIVR